MTDPLEAQLVEGAKNGRLDCFGQLYERYYTSMVAIAYSVLGDGHLAEDAAQETFAVACRDLLALRRADKFAAWLAGICRNVSRQMARSRKEVAAMGPDPAATEPVRDGHADDAVSQALGQLSAAARELVILRYYDNMSYEQMAAVLGISAKAVHGRLVRAKRKLARLLRRHGFPESHYETS